MHRKLRSKDVLEQWQEDYKELFMMLDDYIDGMNKDIVKAEVIFLTHNEDKHWYNMTNNILGEDLLWTPEIQELKQSQ